MEVDLRVVRLIRKIIRDQNDMQTMKESHQDDYFATDYFDIMKVEKKEISSSLTSIIGIWPEDEMNVLDVAVQSYSLYCSAEMMKLEKDRKECGDPFLIENTKMQFLSIIQVHITPEVMAHALVNKTSKEFINAVYEDLHTALDDFISANESEVLVFRIYKMFSAGDFAVVLRTDEAETSFKVSSALKQRRSMDDSDDKKIVLYKTYTLLTFDNNIIKQEIDGTENISDISQRAKTRKDRFVLRGCYSNLYWSNIEKVREYLKKENIFSEIQLYGLNGRYDFSVRITEKQFLELLHDIKEYKETGMQVSDDRLGNGIKIVKDTMSKEDGIVKYIRYLMENHYLSYINERYLVAQDLLSQDAYSEELDALYGNKTSITIDVEPIETRNEFLDCRINEMYELVTNKCKTVHNKVNHIKDYRKNIGHYMNLLDKLIKLCYGINGFSDTRIYAAVLLEQLDIIMDSIEAYVAMYYNTEEKGEMGEILYLLEEYIRESVCALDGYAQYIRNNNLQSLQTPNYNIESNMSMEKLLIGYSELLKVFTEFYQKRKIDLVKKQNQCKYIPIVVPVLSKRDVSVETLFPNGIMNDWNKEKQIRDNLNHSSDRSCMVISVPTLTELGNVRTMVTSLFHEVAHQFRYESRRERNDMLLKYLVHTIIRDIINKLIQKLQDDTGLIDWNVNFGRSLEKSFVEAYMETNYMNDKGILNYSFQESPLNNFRYCFKKDLYDVFECWEQKDDIRSVFNAFLKEIMYYYQSDNSIFSEIIQILDELIEQIELKEIQIMSDEKIVKCAYGLSWECVCQNKDNLARIWEKENTSFREWIENINEFLYKEKWDEEFDIIALADEKDKIEKIWDNFYKFSSWIYEHCGDNENAKFYNNKKKTDFLEKAYQKMCIEWLGKDIQKDLTCDFDSVLSFMGRALGIDCYTEENYKIFKEQMTFVVSQNIDYIVEMAIWRIGKYREETADMFMCNAMKLTPFGYIHMLAVGWPGNQELSNEYYNRSQNILLFQWCLDEKDRLSYSKFRKLCVDMIKILEGAVSRASQRLIDMDVKLDLLQHLNAFPKWDSEDEKQVIDMLDTIEELTNYCKYVEEKIIDYDNSFIKREFEMLKFYDIMANMIGQLVEQGIAQIDYLNDFDELRDDYIRGIKQLNNLNDEMCNDEDPLVQELGEFCKKISVLQNEPYLLIESIEENEKMNICSIEFLLNMYYANKRRVAQQIGGKKCQ